MRLIIAASCVCVVLASCKPSDGDVANVAAVRETEAVAAKGDAADDPAIWVAPDPAESLIISTNKRGAINVFDLQGRIVQTVPGGLPNNVDLRKNFRWAAGSSTLVGASDRSDNSIVLWRFDDAAKKLIATGATRLPTGFDEIYGFCLGRRGEDFVAVATDRDSGNVGVWQVTLSPTGVVQGSRIAAFSLGSITEGCVVDDESGTLFLAEEQKGIWKVSLGDADGSRRRLVDEIGGAGNLVADIEGLSLWRGEATSGYLVASVQGDSRFAVYDRGGDHKFRGSFRIGPSADGNADAVSSTDGLDITSANLGSDFPQGLMVVQDDDNTDPATRQNFKLVSWRDVATALGLD